MIGLSELVHVELVGMREFVPSFPRQIRVMCGSAIIRVFDCNIESVLYRIINRYNSLQTIFYNLYNRVIDKVVFDFDTIESLGKIKDMHHDLIQKNIRHCVLFSGNKGFHVYLFADGEELENPKEALYNTHMQYVKQYGLHTLDELPDWISHATDDIGDKKLMNYLLPDHSVFGDVARVFRVPNTMNMGSGFYCVSLTTGDLDAGIEHIREKAREQHPIVVYGQERISLVHNDKPIAYNNNDVIIKEYNKKLKLSEDDGEIKTFLPCVQHWLLNKETPGHDESGTFQARYFFALYCRDMGISLGDCHRLSKKYFGRVKRKDMVGTNYEHMKQKRVIEQAYKTTALFPACDTLWKSGLCPGRCEHYVEGGSPLYK